MMPSEPLSSRELDVVELLRQGMSNKLIARELGISERTVEFHLTNIYAKYEVSSRVELILKLEEAAGQAESDKLGESTVDIPEENVEDSSRLILPRDWRGFFRGAVSSAGKKLETITEPDREETRKMTFFDAIRVCLTKYAEFEGRASRPEFWWFALFVTLVTTALGYLSEALGSVFLVAVLLPLLAVGARRLHDAGKSAWWLLFGLAPVGGLVVLIWFWSLPPEPAMSAVGEDTTWV